MVTECTALGDKKTKLFVNKQVITLYLMSFLCHFSFTEKGRIYWGNKIGDRFSKQQYFSSSSAIQTYGTMYHFIFSCQST